MSALNPFIQVILALGFQTPEEPLTFSREVLGWAGRRELFCLNSAGTKFSVEAIHGGDKDVWYSESICEGPQNLANLAMALEMIEEDRKTAPKTKPLPEWEFRMDPLPPNIPTSSGTLLNHGMAVASITPVGDTNIYELGRQLAAALTTVKVKP
jgi:hypothetical protein